MTVLVEQLKLRTDARGQVFEPLDSGHFVAQRNAHVVISMPGTVRGNHYHKLGTETIAAMGAALVRYRENGSVRDVTVSAEDVYRFTFPPGIPHAIQNTGNRPSILVVFNTAEYDPDHPDVFEDVLVTEFPE